MKRRTFTKISGIAAVTLTMAPNALLIGHPIVHTQYLGANIRHGLLNLPPLAQSKAGSFAVYAATYFKNGYQEATGDQDIEMISIITPYSEEPIMVWSENKEIELLHQDHNTTEPSTKVDLIHNVGHTSLDVPQEAFIYVIHGAVTFGSQTVRDGYGLHLTSESNLHITDDSTLVVIKPM